VASVAKARKNRDERIVDRLWTISGEIKPSELEKRATGSINR
jgi:hypothetical protein